MWNTAAWMASRWIQTIQYFMFKNNIIQLAILANPLWVLHLIHCFLDCVSLLMPTEIEMIYVILMYFI